MAWQSLRQGHYSISIDRASTHTQGPEAGDDVHAVSRNGTKTQRSKWPATAAVRSTLMNDFELTMTLSKAFVVQGSASLDGT